MIEHFLERIDDDTDLDTVAEIAHASDPRPNEYVTRGEHSAEIATAMQMAVFAQQDTEEEVESLKKVISAQNKVIEDMQVKMDQALAVVMRMAKVLDARGVVADIAA